MFSDCRHIFEPNLINSQIDLLRSQTTLTSHDEKPMN